MVKCYTLRSGVFPYFRYRAVMPATLRSLLSHVMALYVSRKLWARAARAGANREKPTPSLVVASIGCMEHRPVRPGGLPAAAILAWDEPPARTDGDHARGVAFMPGGASEGLIAVIRRLRVGCFAGARYARFPRLVVACGGSQCVRGASMLRPAENGCAGTANPRFSDGWQPRRPRRSPAATRRTAPRVMALHVERPSSSRPIQHWRASCARRSGPGSRG